MRRLLSLALCMCLICGVATAALDTSNAYVDPNSYVWTSTVTLSNSNLSADIEWCVNDRVLHDGELQFEYVYRVNATGSAAVTKLSVGMLASNKAQDIGSFQIDPNDIAPTDAYFGGSPPTLNDANWTFAGMTDGDISYALNYWSVNAPLFGPGSIHDGGTIAGGMLPSPSDVIPEPLTLALLGVGGLAVLSRRRR